MTQDESDVVTVADASPEPSAVTTSSSVNGRGALRLRVLLPGSRTARATTYVACVTSATSETARAQAWVEDLLAPSTQAILRDAGFAPVAVQSA